MLRSSEIPWTSTTIRRFSPWLEQGLRSFPCGTFVASIPPCTFRRLGGLHDPAVGSAPTSYVGTLGQTLNLGVLTPQAGPGALSCSARSMR